MENFEFKSQICTTKEQSERLLALGLNKETADMYYSENPRLLFIRDKGIPLEEEDFPAWTLHRLIETIDYSSNIDAIKELLAAKTMFNDRLYDRVIDIIEHLIQRDEFNKDYLEERVWQ